MNNNSELVINAYKNFIKSNETLMNCRTIAHDKYFNGNEIFDINNNELDLVKILNENENLAVELWLSISEDTKDINPTMKDDILKRKERYSSFNSSDKCWISRLWNINTEEKSCQHCGKIHRSF